MRSILRTITHKLLIGRYTDSPEMRDGRATFSSPLQKVAIVVGALGIGVVGHFSGFSCRVKSYEQNFEPPGRTDNLKCLNPRGGLLKPKKKIKRTTNFKSFFLPQSSPVEAVASRYFLPFF